MRSVVAPAALALAVLLAACCPAPSRAPLALAATEARVAVLTGSRTDDLGRALDARTIADGALVRLQPAEGVSLPPDARLYLVGGWLGADTFRVASAHPMVAPSTADAAGDGR